MTTHPDPTPANGTRGALLTFLLVLFGIFTAMATAMNFFMVEDLISHYPGASTERRAMVFGLAGLGVVSLIGMAGMWMLRKWGLYVYLAAGLGVFAINLNLIGVALPVFTGLIGVAALSGAAAARWAEFR